MNIDIGTPAPWLIVEPFGPSHGGETICAGFAVTCTRCHGISSAFLPAIRKDPHVIARLVEEHNRCSEFPSRIVEEPGEGRWLKPE